MLGNAHVTTILPVIDIERAKRFYTDKLGLKEEGQGPEGEFLYKSAGGSIALVPRGPTSAKHTALSFEVDHIEDMISTLADRGVEFEDYDLPGLKTVDKICVLGGSKAAWFRDTEGNILCLHETKH